MPDQSRHSVTRFGVRQKEVSSVKRVKAACICQTLHFMLKEDEPHDYAVEKVQKEVLQYKQSLQRSCTEHRILEESVQEDGSIIIKIIKQYNNSPVGEYLDA